MSDPIALALIRRLVAEGLLEAADITAIADDLTSGGHIGEALAVNVAFIEGQDLRDEPEPAPHLRLVSNSDGGNG